MLERGVTGSATLVVTDLDTATALGSGDVAVLGTPRLVALCEQATVDAVGGALDAGQTTVGTRVDLEHLRPSYVGATVTATAVLEEVDGRRLRFSVEAHEAGLDGGEELVGRGIVTRAVVPRDRFPSHP